MTDELQALLKSAREWITEDPDPDTRQELENLLLQVKAGEGLDDLQDRFAGPLEFGTAGLRGALGAGPNRMNRVVVLRAAAGLAAYLKDMGASAEARVVIGYDARHKSEQFARDTVAVMEAAGFRPFLMPRPLPTPVLAFAIRELGCVAGVMVTASHNPAQDNGYKVYLGDGSQIVPPADVDISARIAAVGPVSQIRRQGRGQVVGEELLARYLTHAAAVVTNRHGPRDLNVVYTPIHGVGAETAVAALHKAGFAEPTLVPEQAAPNPDFPTAVFPNPEEPGVMDLAMLLAERQDADLVIANDPDADRCAVAVPTPFGWRRLSGDEVGALLGYHLLRNQRRGTYAASIVSSTLLGRMAQTFGQPYVETLTGFKWISRVPGLVFGYEEALGYCADPAYVADKDGITALLLVCDLAATQKAMGRTLLDVLDDIARDFGAHATDQMSVRVKDLSEIDKTMAHLRANPPISLGGLSVETVDDLSHGSATLPPTEGLRYRLTGNARVIVRPSGTEPKLKCYFEAVVPVEGESREAVVLARRDADSQVLKLRRDLIAAADIL